MNKLTQKQFLLKLFAENNNQLTLRQILRTHLAAEYRARLSELRKVGYNITCKENKRDPSENLYTLSEKSLEPLQSTLNKKVANRGETSKLSKYATPYTLRHGCVDCPTQYRHFEVGRVCERC